MLHAFVLHIYMLLFFTEGHSQHQPASDPTSHKGPAETKLSRQMFFSGHPPRLLEAAVDMVHVYALSRWQNVVSALVLSSTGVVGG